MYRLTRLTISTLLGSLSRDTHAVVPVKKDLWASEQLVDLLEGQESGLGVEEVDKRNEASVENAEVDHNDSDDSRAWLSSRYSSCQNSHADCLAGCSEHHQLSATQAINDPDWDERGEEVSDTVEASQQETKVVGDADRFLEDDGGVLGIREAKLGIAADEGHAVVDPVAQHDSENVDGELNGKALSTVTGLHEFRMPDGYEMLAGGFG
ncbi:hypothetical protein HG531_000655 [Fusarium graminearum]|nr:hypothetical protein HG531_000655 [Fusarium graminearum]